jgi:thiamine pyrophosphate-dependent acetolactate synthase large subunit-like protein
VGDRAPLYAVVAETLARLGHTTLFGLLGSGNFKLADHFVRDHGGRFVWTRHEAAAVSAAHAYAHVTCGLGIATVHQGPGFTNTLTSLTQAVKERQPLLLIAGETARGHRVNQTIDLDAAARAAGAGVARVLSADTVVQDVAGAAARAQRERLPVVLPLPIDFQEEPAERGEPEPVEPLNTPRARPAAADVAAVADLVERSSRPVILAGRGAVLADARAPLEALGERIGALLTTSLMGHGLFAGHPASLGVCGGYGSKLLERLLPDADLILAFGASLNQWTTMFGRLLGDAAIVQCDADPQAIGRYRPVRLGLSGDAAEAADALREELERRGFASEGFRAGDVAADVCAYSAAEDYADEAGDNAIDPRTLVVELDRLLPAERTVVYDCGHWTWFVTPFLTVPDPASFVPAQGFMAVGHGLATAAGAAVARPDRPVLALTGDGGAMMALGELDSITGQRLDVLIAVFNDAAYGAEVHHFGPMGRPTGMVEFGDRDFAAIASALGARAATIRSADDLAAPVQDWLARRGGPLVLDCKVDPRVVSERLAEAFAGGA